MLKRFLEWDRDAFVYLNNLGVEEYDLFWSTVTKFPPWIPLFLLFIFLFFKKFDNKEAFYLLGMVILLALFVATITDLTKEVVARLRPNNDVEINTLIRILRSPNGYSFFSGHSSSSFSITTLVVLFLRRRFKWAYLFYIWPILFATSRIFVGVHFPIDIIMGALIGVLSAFMFHTIYTRFIAPYLRLSHP